MIKLHIIQGAEESRYKNQFEIWKSILREFIIYYPVGRKRHNYLQSFQHPQITLGMAMLSFSDWVTKPKLEDREAETE
jgi:hypothetical protein